MTQTPVNLTIIHSQKLRNIVGQGVSSPYQVSITTGRSLGFIGRIVHPGVFQASNGDYSIPEPVANPSWAQRVLRTMGLKRS